MHTVRMRTKEKRLHEEEDQARPATHCEFMGGRKRDETPDDEDRSVEAAEHHISCEENEVLLVVRPDTIVDPRTVMIHPCNAVPADLHGPAHRVPDQCDDQLPPSQLPEAGTAPANKASKQGQQTRREGEGEASAYAAVVRSPRLEVAIAAATRAVIRVWRALPRAHWHSTIRHDARVGCHRSQVRPCSQERQRGEGCHSVKQRLENGRKSARSTR
jgi:hypothetical protein